MGGDDPAQYVGTRYMQVKIHCIRVYRRHLTEEEVLWNRIVDKDRFGIE